MKKTCLKKGIKGMQSLERTLFPCFFLPHQHPHQAKKDIE